MAFALAFMAGMALVASIKRIDLSSGRINDIAPVTEPAEIHYEFPGGQGRAVQL